MPLVGSMSSSLVPVGPSSMRSAEAASENRNGRSTTWNFGKMVSMNPEVCAQKSMMPVCSPVRILVPLPSCPMLKTWMSMSPDVRLATSSEKRLSTS